MDTHGGPTGDVIAGQIAGIGRNGEAESSFFNGAVDDLAVWSRALTPDEVASLAAGAPILGGEAPGSDFQKELQSRLAPYFGGVNQQNR